MMEIAHPVTRYLIDSTDVHPLVRHFRPASSNSFCIEQTTFAGVALVSSGVALVSSGVILVSSGVALVSSGVALVSSGVALVSSGVVLVSSGIALISAGIARLSAESTVKFENQIHCTIM